MTAVSGCMPAVTASLSRAIKSVKTRFSACWPRAAAKNTSTRLTSQCQAPSSSVTAPVRFQTIEQGLAPIIKSLNTAPSEEWRAKQAAVQTYVELQHIDQKNEQDIQRILIQLIKKGMLVEKTKADGLTDQNGTQGSVTFDATKNLQQNLQDAQFEQMKFVLQQIKDANQFEQILTAAVAHAQSGEKSMPNSLILKAISIFFDKTKETVAAANTNTQPAPSADELRAAIKQQWQQWGIWYSLDMRL